MELKRSWLRINQNGRWELYLPPTYLAKSKRIKISFGSVNRTKEIAISSTLEDQRRNGFLVHIRKLQDQSIKIGPLIGILTVKTGRRLRGNFQNYKDLTLTGKQIGGICFVFTPDDIDWKKKEVTGLLYLPEVKRWTQIKFPMPDIVYNRIPYRELERKPDVQQTLKSLQQIPTLNLFNPHFFDKWELFQVLQRTPLSKHLPKTSILQSKQTLDQMLGSYPILYLKPIDGRAGEGILRLEKEEAFLSLSYSVDGEKKTNTFYTTDQLWNYLKQWLKQQPYLIQEAIPLLTYKGAPFDARVLAQKEITGKWQVSGIGVRVAGIGGITTHVPQGGAILNPLAAFTPYFGDGGTKELLKRIGNTAVQIAESLDFHYHTLGEMSMDLGITKSGDIWFFEANAKPMKFDEPEIRKISLARVIQYSQYLSKFA